MAELLGVASSIIAVLQAADRINQLFEHVKTYRDAPNEVLALINEISDVHLLLNEQDAIANELVLNDLTLGFCAVL